MSFIFLQRPVLRHLFIAAVFLFPSQVTEARADQPVPVLKLVGGQVSEDGHVKIEWVTAKEAEVEVQQAENENFEGATVVYRGPDKATFISGLESGTYYYRIRHIGGSWSDPVTLTVNHHSLHTAFVLFSLGAVVFALTVFVVVKGALHASAD